LVPAEEDFRAVTRLSGWEAEAWWGLARVAKARGDKRMEADCRVRYKAAVRRRDKQLDDERRRGIEAVAAYEPGLPLAPNPRSALNP
jgi:hypothetical protein